MQPFAAWTARDVVAVAGPDAVEYLQGQLSQDVTGLTAGASRWTLLLQPSGKVVAWLRMTRVGEHEVLLDGDDGSGAAVVERLRRFLLRTKAEISLRPGEPCLAVRGRAPSGTGLPIVWPGVDGYDQLGPSAPPPTDLPLRDATALDVARIAHGVPANGRELTDATIPAEAGDWLIEASVDFTKGCYTGQELVARVDSRGGNVPRPLRGIVVRGVATNDLVGEPVTVDGKAVGVVTSAQRVSDAGVTVALAPLARTVEVGATVQVDGVEGEVRPFPLL